MDTLKVKIKFTDNARLLTITIENKDPLGPDEILQALISIQQKAESILAAGTATEVIEEIMH